MEGDEDEAVQPGVPVLPGFREMALRRMATERAGLLRDLLERRRASGLSQTEVAARMGTSQSAVARLEAGASDVRASTLERYAAAIGSEITWQRQARSSVEGGEIGVRRSEMMDGTTQSPA